MCRKDVDTRKCVGVSLRHHFINLLNNEICCNFTHMIITNGIDLDSNMTPLCGAV